MAGVKKKPAAKGVEKAVKPGKPGQWPPKEPASIEALYSLIDPVGPSALVFQMSLWAPRFVELHMECGHHDRALACLDGMTRTYEAPCEQVVMSGLMAMRAARRGLTDLAARYLAPAEAHLEAARRRLPARASMVMAPLGAAQVLLGRRAEGMALLDAARAEIQPDFERGRVAVARAYLGAGELSRALDVISETPDMPDRLRPEIGALLHEAGLSGDPAVLSRVLEACAPSGSMTSEIHCITESFIRMNAHRAGLEALSYFKHMHTLGLRDRIVWDWLRHDRDAALSETARMHSLATHPSVRIGLARITSQADPARATQWIEAEVASNAVAAMVRSSDSLAALTSACALVGRFDRVETYAARATEPAVVANALCAALAPTLPTEDEFAEGFTVPPEVFVRLSARAAEAAEREGSAHRHASLAAAAFLQGDAALREAQLALARARLGTYDAASTLRTVARANDTDGLHYLFLSAAKPQRKRLYPTVLPALVAHRQIAALHDLLSQLDMPTTHDGSGCRGQELLGVLRALEGQPPCVHPLWTW